MDSDTELIVSALRRTRNWLVLMVVLTFFLAVQPAVKVIQGKEWGWGVVSFLFFLSAFVLLNSFSRQGLLSPQKSPLLNVLVEHPDMVLWVSYDARNAAVNAKSWKRRMRASWPKTGIVVRLADGQGYPLAGSGKDAKALLEILRKRAPHADFGNSKEMKERYEARVKAWREAQSQS
jgi:hypothetical protein